MASSRRLAVAGAMAAAALSANAVTIEFDVPTDYSSYYKLLASTGDYPEIVRDMLANPHPRLIGTLTFDLAAIEAKPTSELVAGTLYEFKYSDFTFHSNETDDYLLAGIAPSPDPYGLYGPSTGREPWYVHVRGLIRDGSLRYVDIDVYPGLFKWREEALDHVPVPHDVVPAVPEPQSWAFLLAGLLATGAWSRRRSARGL